MNFIRQEKQTLLSSIPNPKKHYFGQSILLKIISFKKEKNYWNLETNHSQIFKPIKRILNLTQVTYKYKATT